MYFSSTCWFNPRTANALTHFKLCSKKRCVIHRYLKQNYLFITKQNKTKANHNFSVVLQATLIPGSVFEVCMDILQSQNRHVWCIADLLWEGWPMGMAFIFIKMLHGKPVQCLVSTENMNAKHKHSTQIHDPFYCILNQWRR